MIHMILHDSRIQGKPAELLAFLSKTRNIICYASRNSFESEKNLSEQINFVYNLFDTIFDNEFIIPRRKICVQIPI
jgi:hypothetical protein